MAAYSKAGSVWIHVRAVAGAVDAYPWRMVCTYTRAIETLRSKLVNSHDEFRQRARQAHFSEPAE